MTKPYVISLDGLHRCGKGTQLNLLKGYFNENNLYSKIMRGHSSRKGKGSPDDPSCDWWQSLQPLLREINEDGNLDIEPWIQASDRLNWELHEAYNQKTKQTNPEDNNLSYLLLDRSVISHYFMMKRENLVSDFNEVTTFPDPDGNELPVIIPDISFIIHASKSTLLERNELSADYPEKYEFRKKNINDFYDIFEEITNDIAYLGLNIKHIDGSKPIGYLFWEIIETLSREGYIRQCNYPSYVKDIQSVDYVSSGKKERLSIGYQCGSRVII